MNNFKTAVLLSLMMILLMLAGRAFGGQSGMIMMFGFSLLLNFVSYWYSDKIVLKMYKAREVDAQSAPELFRMVSALARRARLPMPKVYVINTDVPNAFATGRNPEHAAVAATSGIMRALSYEELEGVLSHELAHVKNRDTLICTVAATMAGAITMLADMLRWGMILGGGRRDSNDNNSAGAIATIAMVILAPLAAMLIQMAISRSREFVADETGGRISGKPLALASALRKIENYAQRKVLPDATPATSNMFIINPLGGVRSLFGNLFSTHPATSKRIAKLEELARNLR
ncbi:MAG: zinc metalloprotease HtpX [Acidaminococcales bacterium]|jgi:heat shock protein HtpX|nr:zinc metalloprotease HtpX [Acidaminococcales bacterium]